MRSGVRIFHVEPRTVDVHIRRLRKSINGDGELDVRPHGSHRRLRAGLLNHCSLRVWHEIGAAGRTAPIRAEITLCGLAGQALGASPPVANEAAETGRGRLAATLATRALAATRAFAPSLQRESCCHNSEPPVRVSPLLL